MADAVLLALMGNPVLRLIPKDPKYVPDVVTRRRAEVLLRAFAPRADSIRSRVLGKVTLVDAGPNTEIALCPSCRTPVAHEWLSGEISRLALGAFIDLRLVLPGCETLSTLNTLTRAWPAGFASYALEASNPGLGGFVDARRPERLETELRSSIKQILAFGHSAYRRAGS